MRVERLVHFTALLHGDLFCPDCCVCDVVGFHELSASQRIGSARGDTFPVFEDVEFFVAT